MILEISEPTLRLTRRSLLVSSASAAALLTLPVSRFSSLALAAQTPAATSGVFLDRAIVHDVVATFDQDDYDAMIATFQESGDKEWLKASLTIDGQSFEEVGLRLKGNSSLMALRQNGGNFGAGGNGGDAGPSNITNDAGTMPTFNNMDGTPVANNIPVTTEGQPGDGPTFDVQMDGNGGNISAGEPEGLPWLVRLDKYVDDQNYNGLSEFVIRSNNSETALNEALTLDLLQEAGLASQAAAYIQFTANGQGPRLRLAIENPDDVWLAEHFTDPGTLFKSESDGNWSWKDDDLDAYMTAFDLEAGGGDDDADNYAPLISFLDFVNNSDDATFASDLGGHLDIDKFATYLAMMDLVQNDDDIDGPGNNSYLFYDESTGIFTIVPWDMNLAFSMMRVVAGDGGPGGGGQRPPRTNADGTPIAGQMPNMIGPDGTPVAGQIGGNPGGGQMPPPGQGGDNFVGGGGMGGMNNPLTQRWAEVDAFTALQADAKARLTTELFESGTATGILAGWVQVLETHATDLIDQSTIDSESQSLQEKIDAV